SRLPQAGSRRAEDLLTQEVLNAIAIPEMAELVELAQNRQTWLAQLLTAYNALYEPPRAPKKLKGDVT
ncbi:PasA protein, partial [Pseudomonas amygdali pv. tabaci str. ATCC 11528]